MFESLLFCFLVFALIKPVAIKGQALEKRIYAIKNVTVIPMNKEISLPDRTVIVEDGIIKFVGKAFNTRIDEDIIAINGQGKYLIPGLFDMHAHFFYEQGDYKNTCVTELKNDACQWPDERQNTGRSPCLPGRKEQCST